MPVVDASVLVEYVGGGEHVDVARSYLMADRGALWAPHLVDAEVGHALRRMVAAGDIRPHAARAGLKDLAEMPLQRAPHRGLMDRAWALRENVSFYYGLYLALAEALEAPLLTLDTRLAGVPGTCANVLVIA